MPAIPDPATEPTVTPRRAAALLGVGHNAIYSGIKEGNVPAIKIGKTFHIPSAWLCRVLAGFAA